MQADAPPWYALTPRTSIRFRFGLVQQLLQMNVGHEPQPETLQHVEQEALAAIEKAEAQEVAVQEVQHGAPVERQPVPDVLEPCGALVGRAQRRRSDGAASAPAAQQLLLREQPRVAALLHQPEVEHGLFLVVL